MANKEEHKISNEVLKIIHESDPQDRIIINVAVRNLKNQHFNDGNETAYTISESLYKKLREKNMNDVRILKVEFPDYQSDEPLVNEEGFNNFLDIEFVKQLTGIEDNEDENFILVGGTQNQDMDLTFTMDEEELQQPIILRQDNGPSQIQQFLLQMRKVYFHGQSIANMTKVIHQIPLNKDDQVLNVLLECCVSQINLLNNFRFNLLGRSEPLFLSLNAARNLHDKIQIEEYSTKMGKLPVSISTFQVGILQQIANEKANDTSNNDHNFNISPNVEVEFFQYFDFNKFLDPKIKLQMYYHKENSKLQNQIELIINFFGKVLFKIQIDLTYCHYAIMEEQSEQRVLFFKMLSPPTYQVSIMKERRYEMFNLKSDWTRIENVFLRMMVEEKLINEIQRLILINNSVIRIVIPINQNNEVEDYLINILMEKLNEYQLTKIGEEIDIVINDRNPHQFLEQIKVDFKELPFNCKYNILAAFSQNKFNTKFSCNKLVTYLQKKQQEINNDKEFEKIQEHTFQQFNKMADNINLYIDQMYVNQRNLLIFNKEFKRTREEIIITDYTNPKLAFIFRMSLTPSGLIYYHKMPEETSKVIRDYRNNLDKFIRLHFEDENQDSMHGITHISKYFYYDLMIKGVIILDKKFNLLTWSASQLRTGSCWLLDSQIQRVKVIDSIGDFSEKLKIEQTAKNAARLGQNFSSSTMFKFRNDIIVEFIPDSKDNEGKLYTDGIGCISQDLVDELKKAFQIPFFNAIQIRFHGAKGVLVLKNGIPKNTIQLRYSMVKFDPSKMNNREYDNEISVLDYNKFRGGYLNRQVILLLQTLGISDEVFIQLQNEYLERIQGITIIDSSIYKHYNVEYNAETQGLTSIASIIRDMVNSNLIDKNNQFISSVLNRLKQRGLLQLRTKCNILVEKAARLLGVIDEYNILQSDEVYAFVGIDPAKPEMIDSEYVVITRNPCLHPGDIRKVRLIKDEEIKERNNGINPYFPNLVNCLIFPQAGPALTAQCGGGDLDGDVYFITWDERLIIKQNDNPMVYDEEKNQNSTPQLNLQVESSESYFYIPKMLEFMFQYLDSDVLGKIDNSHLAIADQSKDKARDERCLQLAKLHGQAVDYVKHGQLVQVPPRLLAKQWPDYMEKSNKLLTYESQNVLGKLYRTVIELSQNAMENNQILMMGYQCDILNDINTKLIYNYQDLVQDDIDDLKKQEQPLLNDDYANQISEKIKQYVNQFAKPYFKCVIDCLSHIFETIDGLRKIYYIKNEYEIYTGYYTNFTKGEGTRLKKKLNVDNIQKRVIQHLVVLKNEVNKMIGQDNILEKISLFNFILSYSPKSHNYSIETNLGQFVWFLVKQLQQEAIFSRLCVKYVHWYRGCIWFFFHKELLSMPQKTDIIEEKEQNDNDNDNDELI